MPPPHRKKARDESLFVKYHKPKAAFMSLLPAVPYMPKLSLEEVALASEHYCNCQYFTLGISACTYMCGSGIVKSRDFPNNTKDMEVGGM